MSDLDIPTIMMEGTEADACVAIVLEHFSKNGYQALSALQRDDPKEYLMAVYAILQSRELAFPLEDADFADEPDTPVATH